LGKQKLLSLAVAVLVQIQHQLVPIHNLVMLFAWAVAVAAILLRHQGVALGVQVVAVQLLAVKACFYKVLILTAVAVLVLALQILVILVAWV